MELRSIFQLLFNIHQLSGKHLSSAFHLLCSGLITLGTSLIRIGECLPGVLGNLVTLRGQPPQLHFQLIAVADDSRSLTLNLLMALTLGLSCLCNLNLRIRIVFDLLIERRHHVLPALGKWISHANPTFLNICGITNRNREDSIS